MSCSLLVTSAYLNSNDVRVDTQIGGNRESIGILLVGVDGGIYDWVFGSNAGNFNAFDFDVCFDSDPPHGDDSSPNKYAYRSNQTKRQKQKNSNKYHFCFGVVYPSCYPDQLDRILAECHR